MTLRSKVRVLFAAIAMLVGSFLVTPSPAKAALPVGTCGASQGCGCGGIYVLKYHYILVYC